MGEAPGTQKAARAKKVAQDLSAETPITDFRRIERREWWLWLTAIIVTRLLMAGVSSLILPALRMGEDTFS